MTDTINNLCFIDSNVWLYALATDQKDETKRIIAKQLIKTQNNFENNGHQKQPPSVINNVKK
jgi:predicted nucleic acid-binding protein